MAEYVTTRSNQKGEGPALTTTTAHVLLNAGSAELVAAGQLRPKPVAYSKLNTVSSKVLLSPIGFSPPASAITLNSVKSVKGRLAQLRPSFNLDCCSLGTEKLPNYNGPGDRNLDDFFRKKVYHRQLVRLRRTIARQAATKSAANRVHVLLHARLMPQPFVVAKREVHIIYEQKGVVREIGLEMKLPEIKLVGEKARKKKGKRRTKNSEHRLSETRNLAELCYNK